MVDGKKDDVAKTKKNHSSQIIGEIVVFTIMLLMLVTCYCWFCIKPSPYDVTKNSGDLNGKSSPKVIKAKTSDHQTA